MAKKRTAVKPASPEEPFICGTPFLRQIAKEAKGENAAPHAPSPAKLKPSALLDTRVTYCGDSL